MRVAANLTRQLIWRHNSGLRAMGRKRHTGSRGFIGALCSAVRFVNCNDATCGSNDSESATQSCRHTPCAVTRSERRKGRRSADPCGLSEDGSIYLNWRTEMLSLTGIVKPPPL